METEQKLPDYFEEGTEEVKAGDTEKTKITELKAGVLKDFVNKEYIKKAGEAVGDQKAIRITTENGADLTMTTPKKISPNAHIAKFKRQYGKYPEKDMEVTTIIDEDGYSKIILAQ